MGAFGGAILAFRHFAVHNLPAVVQVGLAVVHTSQELFDSLPWLEFLECIVNFWWQVDTDVPLLAE